MCLCVQDWYVFIMTALRQRKGSKGKEPGPEIQNLNPDTSEEPTLEKTSPGQVISISRPNFLYSILGL